MKGDPECLACPTCPKGSGLNQRCQQYFPYESEEIPYCVACIDGLSFSEYESTGECDLCSPIDFNQREVKKCTKFHNRFSECNHGFFEGGALNKCNQQCCHCEDGAKFVPKCQKDMTNRMWCAPSRSDGKCDEKVSNVKLIPPTHVTAIPTMKQPSLNTLSVINSSSPSISPLENKSTIFQPKLPIPIKKTSHTLPQPTTQHPPTQQRPTQQPTTQQPTTQQTTTQQPTIQQPISNVSDKDVMPERETTSTETRMVNNKWWIAVIVGGIILAAAGYCFYVQCKGMYG